jgi:hypothetical protein
MTRDVLDWLLRGAGRLLRGAVAAWLALTIVASSSAAQLPAPREGTWAPASLALLKHSEARCSNLGIRITRYWQGLNGSVASQQRSIDRYLVNRATADMAAARRALDIAKRFLPEARRETNSLVGNVLVKLHGAATDLCNSVAEPGSVRADFEAQLERQNGRLAALTSDLGELVEITDAELREALKPYMKPIEAAIQRAETQNERDLTPLQKPLSKIPSKQHEMEAWHQTYVNASLATRLALGEYVQGRRANDAERIRVACRDLQGAASGLLAQEEVFKVPDNRVELPLRAAYGAMNSLANDCVIGNFRDVEEHFGRVEANLSSLGETLRRYALMP